VSLSEIKSRVCLFLVLTSNRHHHLEYLPCPSPLLERTLSENQLKSPLWRGFLSGVRRGKERGDTSNALGNVIFLPTIIYCFISLLLGNVVVNRIIESSF